MTLSLLIIGIMALIALKIIGDVVVKIVGEKKSKKKTK